MRGKIFIFLGCLSVLGSFTGCSPEEKEEDPNVELDRMVMENREVIHRED